MSCVSYIVVCGVIEYIEQIDRLFEYVSFMRFMVDDYVTIYRVIDMNACTHLGNTCDHQVQSDLKCIIVHASGDDTLDLPRLRTSQVWLSSENRYCGVTPAWVEYFLDGL